MQPREPKNDPLLSKSSYIKMFIEFSVSKFKLEVDIGINCSSLVFHSVHVIGLYQFVQVVNFKVFGKVLINKQSTSAAVDKGFDSLFTQANIDRNRDRIP
jgi:hypothetical protein